MSDWKSDPVEFLKMKVRYGSLLGVLHGALYLIEQMEDSPEKDKMLSIYSKMHSKTLDEIQEIVADIFNCGWMDQQPDIEWIVSDNFLQDKFPIKEGEPEER
jgi:hypothetical protein